MSEAVGGEVDAIKQTRHFIVFDRLCARGQARVQRFAVAIVDLLAFLEDPLDGLTRLRLRAFADDLENLLRRST
jgi:hypothetical protein